MKKTIKIFGYAGLQILSVFLFPMAFTFFSEWLSTTGFYGDTQCITRCNSGIINDGLDWGIRHYLYFYLCLSLFCFNIARAVVMSIEYMEKLDNR